MSVVTIRGNMGSGAPEIGKFVAGKLHFDYVDREIIDKVAELLQGKKHDIEMKEMPPGSLSSRIGEALDGLIRPHARLGCCRDGNMKRYRYQRGKNL